MHTKCTAPSREIRAATPRVSARNLRNCAVVISPEAIANSRWRPAAFACPLIFTLYGGSRKAASMADPLPITRRRKSMSRPSPQPNRCSPSTQTSPNLVRGCSGMGGMISSAGSFAAFRATSISPDANPVNDRSKSISSALMSCSSNLRISKSHPAFNAILLSAKRSAFF